MSKKKILMKYSEFVKSIQFAHESATGDDLDVEVAKEMAEFMVDDLGLSSYVEFDEVEEEEPDGEDEDDA